MVIQSTEGKRQQYQSLANRTVEELRFERRHHLWEAGFSGVQLEIPWGHEDEAK